MDDVLGAIELSTQTSVIDIPGWGFGVFPLKILREHLPPLPYVGIESVDQAGRTSYPFEIWGF